MSYVAPQTSPAKRIALYRQKARREGLSRLEITVPRHDAVLLRQAASVLREGGPQAMRMREQLSEIIPKGPARTAKELLAFFQNSPLAKGDIDLTRDPSPIPDVEF